MKNMKTIFFTVAMVATVFTSLAQDASDILNKLSEKAKTYKTVYATFDFELENLKAGVKEKQSGEVFLKEELYHINLDKYEIICDGTTQYTIDTELNEGSADLLEDLEGDDDALSPNKLFTIWETGFKNSFDSESTKDGVTYQVINLYPNNPENESYHTIKLTIIKDKMELYKAMVMGKSGETFIYTIKEFVPNKVMGADKFTYNPANYPGIDMIENF